VLIGLLYYRPVSAYFHTRAVVAQRAAEVEHLRAQRDSLRAGFERVSQELTLAREARQLSLVRPGERLYVVTGVQRWRNAHPGTR